MKTGRTIAVVLLLAGVVVSFLLRQPVGLPGDDSSAANLPDGYYLTGVALTGMGPNGEVSYRLRAQRVDHRPGDDSIELTRLELDYGNASKPWTIRATSGSMPASNDFIDLTGGVWIENPTLSGQGPTSVASDTLRMDIRAQSARTDDPVKIVIGQGSLDGVGLEVDFANETLKLVSNVHGVFVPPQP